MAPRQSQRIVITGIGVVSPNGFGKDEYWRNCAAGVSGIKPITLFDVSPYRCRIGGEVADFQPAAHLGPKGLRNLDRTTLLALVGAKLAMEDAGLELNGTVRDDTGVVLGSTMGSVNSISEFDMEGLREGPRYVNPALFPNVVINSPASQVSIRFKLRGLNSTIATGFTAGLDAIGYALDMLELGRARRLVVGGVEELCRQTFLGFYKMGYLRRGTLLGEGAAFFVLEPLDEARRRGASVQAELLGYHSTFDPDSMYRYDPAAAGAVRTLRRVLDEAGVRPGEIDHISACANSTHAMDAMETTAVKTAFGTRVPRSAVKSLLGESFSAAGALQLAAAVGAVARQQAPPTVDWEPEGSDMNRDGMPNKTRAGRVNTALVEAFGLTGISSALVVREARDA